MSCATLVLAAGASRRFGAEPKQAQPWRGRAMLTHMAERAAEVTPGQVFVVLGADAVRLAPLVPAGCNIVVNDAWAEGLGASIARGVGALPAETTAVVIVLGDQLGVTRECLTGLVRTGNAHSGAGSPVAVCAAYQNTRGVPAYFPRCYFPALAGLAGSSGAKALLMGAEVATVSMPQAAIDIDTPADFIAFENRERASAKAID
ncbi:nucleotidyltransferase family protein [Simiduia sp. 21SJ11W-1]|uniref:nucleotidyltransferase family protein n=1 Tax=Simiduia sp. 21SJ11W-1 TaxID=2909669 RepID=UPI00209D1F05|nr:nucleotidyltransferase family protein [Simiduia sp. 21SJ11W-1]UTA46776.1 nucleotidyltransferase family protein [Simiduia sp. 21SJ11W-1]